MTGHADGESPRDAGLRKRAFLRDYRARLTDVVLGEAQLRETETARLARSALRNGVAFLDLFHVHTATVADLGSEAPLSPAQQTLCDAFHAGIIAFADRIIADARSSRADLIEEVRLRRGLPSDPASDTLLADAQIHETRDLLEHRTRRLLAQLDEMRRINEQLERQRRDQKAFTYAISHDLQHPLTSAGLLLDFFIEAQADMSLDLADLRDAREMIGRIKQIVCDLVGFSTAVEADPVREPVDLAALLVDIAKDLSAEIAQSGARIACEALPTVTGTPFQLRVLFQNLLSNAIKFRRPNVAPVIKVSDVSTVTHYLAVVEVSDNGIGIPVGDRERIFEIFSRLHGADAYRGTGLGLALCRRIVEEHGGTIRVASRSGEGSTFRIRLPR